MGIDHGHLVTYESTLAMRGITDQQFVNKTLKMRDRFMIFVTCVVKSWLEHCRYSMLICLAAPSPLRCVFQQQCHRELRPMLCVERALIYRQLAPPPPITKAPNEENEHGEEEESTTAAPPSLMDNLLNKDWDTNMDFESLVTNMSGRFFSFAVCLAKDWVNHCKANGFGCILAPQPFVCLTIMECNNQVDTNFCIETALSSSSNNQESVSTVHRPGLPRSFVDELASNWSANKIDLIGLVKSMGAKAMKFLVCAGKKVFQVCKEHVINCAFDSSPLKRVFKMNCVKLANYTQCIETALTNIAETHKEATEGAVLNQEMVGQVLEVTSETPTVEIDDTTEEIPVNEVLSSKPEGELPIKRENPETHPYKVPTIAQPSAPIPGQPLIFRTTPSPEPVFIFRATPLPVPTFRAPPSTGPAPPPALRAPPSTEPAPQPPPRKQESVLPLVKFGVVNNLLHKLAKK